MILIYQEMSENTARQNQLMEGFEEKPEDIMITNLDQSFQGQGYIDIFSVKHNTNVNEDNLMQIQIASHVGRSNEHNRNSFIQNLKRDSRGSIYHRKDKSSQIVMSRKTQLMSQTPVEEFKKESESEQSVLSSKESQDSATSLYKNLRVYMNMKQFVSNISVKRRSNLLFKPYHFQIISDKAAEKQEKLSIITEQPVLLQKATRRSITTKKFVLRKKNSIVGKTFRKIRIACKQCMKSLETVGNKVLYYIPLIYPDQLYKICWDLLLCVALMYIFVQIPLEISFHNRIFMNQNIYPTIASLVIVILDYLFKFNTVYYKYGKAVIDRSLILTNYFTDGLIIDGISILVLLFYILINGEVYELEIRYLSIVLVLFYSQFQYISKITSNIQESISLGKTSTSLLDLIKLILTLLYSQHVFSCIWYFTAVLKQVSIYSLSSREHQNENNWMRYREIVDQEWTVQYLDSFYFSTVTMLSVGYGDITPQNSLEKVLSIIFMMLACIQLSYTVNTVGTIIANLTSGEEEMKGKIRIINKFMSHKNITFGLKYQIREYLKSYWQQEQEQENENDEEKTIISKLSNNLRNRLILETNQTLISQCKLISQSFSQKTQEQLLTIMKTVVITPENQIDAFLPNLNEPSLCFIESGELDVTKYQYYSQIRLPYQKGEYKESEFQTLKQGSYFGLEEFITGNRSNVSYISQSFVKLTIIQQSEFLKILKDNPEDYEVYCQLKDKHNQKINSDFLQCISCKQRGHQINECPIIHFKADREKIIKQYQFPCSQQRYHLFERGSRAKNDFFALTDQWAIKELAEIYYTNCSDSLMVLFEEINHIYDNKFSNIENQVVAKPTQGYPFKNLMLFKSKDDGKCTNKFKRTVKMIIQMMKFTPLKQKLTNNRKLIESRKQKDKNIHNFNQNLMKQVEYLVMAMADKYDNEQMHYRDLEMLHLKLSVKNELNSFDIFKEYETYMPYSNLSLILRQARKTRPQISFAATEVLLQKNDLLEQSQKKRNKILSQTLQYYMFYPNQYFERVSKQQQKRSQNPIPASQTYVKKVVNELRIKQKMILQRKNQVFPIM